MAIDYGGVSSLAQAVLAINLAYVALDRFRYKAAVERMFEDKKQQLSLPSETETDLGWVHLRELAPGDSDAWGKYVVAHFFCSKMFDNAFDRRLSYFFSLVTILMLWAHAYYGFILEDSGVTFLPTAWNRFDAAARCIVLDLLTAGIIFPILLLVAGWYMLSSINKRMTYLGDHLGGALLRRAGDKLSATERKLER